MSYLEKTARKLHPILDELKKKMIPEKSMTAGTRKSIPKGKVETLDSIRDDFDYDKYEEKIAPDMKNILGYLN